MAFGQKLGKVFGAIGSGLSFIPGPWSAVGMALGAAGGIAGAVGEAKNQKQEQQEQMPVSQPQEPVDRSRPQQAQLNVSQDQQPQPMNMNAPRYMGRPNLGSYQNQLDMTIANALIRDVGSLYDD